MTDQDGLFPPPTTTDVRMIDKIHEVEREIKQRKHLYPRWIIEGKITDETAHKRVLILEAVLADLYILLNAENETGE